MKTIESCRRYEFLWFSTAAWHRFRRYFRWRLQTWDLVQTPVKKSFMVLVDLFPSTKLSQRKFINLLGRRRWSWWLVCWWNCTLKPQTVVSQTLPLHHVSFWFANDKIQPVLLLDSVFHGLSNATSPVWRFGSSILSRVEMRRGVVWEEFLFLFLSKMFSALGWQFENQPP